MSSAPPITSATPPTGLRALLQRSPALVRAVRRIRGWGRAWIFGERPEVWKKVVQQALRDALTARPGACFVQVGSNDGQAGDPLYELAHSTTGCRGVLIEPVPALFARLRQNYAEERFQCINAAVAEASGEKDFFMVSEEGVAQLRGKYPWADQINSFRREHITEDYGGVFAPYLKTIRVPGVRLDELLQSLHVERVDVLHTDVEGYDFKVLQTFDWGRFHPAVVLFEHQHLGLAGQAEAAAFLQAKGYRLRVVGQDTLALATA